ncbi:diversity-generating retroelement protein bAvd family protein [Echinicola strongylocentroti]|uniref:Diversity-generating retroelement protein bAvd family protein n=1 Tax=Echinicola strongylocentroti TaxID=1795355 RepID=A0A2Z4IHL9_9BACT|nr:four helix bundle protein [Echinicola strongylocentroti]AWW30464.1 diversity-generating retroelement protein bAvd family protein [Echinicola strongylocentroti]
MHRYKELQVWKKAIDLAVEVYKITEGLPKQEKFGLISQINRAVVSIPSNIAEGAGRNSDKEFDQFLGIALGSAFELDTQLVISNKLNYIEESDFMKVSKDLETIHNMIFGLKRSLKK